MSKKNFEGFGHDFRVGVTGSSAILSILGGGRPRHHCEPKQPGTGIRGALGLGSLIRLSEKMSKKSAPGVTGSSAKMSISAKSPHPPGEGKKG